MMVRCAIGLCAVLAFAGEVVFADSLADRFRTPPDDARPQVWWHWMNGNVTKEGITADLEAMAAIGIGGAHIFDVRIGIPKGPVASASITSPRTAWSSITTFP